MDPQYPDKLVLVAMDIASSLKLISGELSAIAGNLTRLEQHLASSSPSSDATPNGKRNLDLEMRYPPAPPDAQRGAFFSAHNVMATDPDRRPKHHKFCPCPWDCEFRARTSSRAGDGEDSLERARRRR